MSSSSRWALLHGTPELPPERIPLQAGPLSMMFEDGDLRLREIDDADFHKGPRGAFYGLRVSLE